VKPKITTGSNIEYNYPLSLIEETNVTENLSILRRFFKCMHLIRECVN